MNFAEARRLRTLVAIVRPFAFAPCVWHVISTALEPRTNWAQIDAAVETAIETVPGLYLKTRLQEWLSNGKEAAKAA